MAPPHPDADRRAPGTRRSWRPAVIVAAALAAVLLLAVLADGRLLVADPDPSVVTEADIRLARSLFGDATPPESLARACIHDDGTVEPACLGDGLPGDGSATSTDVIPRVCRQAGSISASCIERELGIDVPDECTFDDRIDVGCLAEAGALLVLTDRCVEDERLRIECLTGWVYGVPDPGAEDTPEAVTTAVAAPDGRDPVATDPSSDRPDQPEPDEPADDEDDDDAFLAGLFEGIGLLVLVVLGVGVAVAVVVAALRGRRSRVEPARPAADEGAHDRAVMAASLDAGARELDLSGDPRQAIIAAYALLLEGLAACAQARHPAETPLEHLERVLAALDVRPEPLRDLTSLFGEARFSDHAMTDVQRDRARAALAAAAADLDRVREVVP